jgi:uncharacterized membrane protein
VSKYHKWLRAEIARWQSEGLIESGLAAQLSERYAVTDRGWGRMVFSVIGAVLLGLGVILFFAYNWEDLPKFAKLGVIFAALLGSHAAALWCDRHADGQQSLVEGLHVLGTMIFGAAIWLIAQIYHIDEHYPNAFLLWSLAALTLAWAMPSLAQGFLAVLLVVLWSAFDVFDFKWTNHWAPLLMAGGIVPLAWWQRSRVLLFFALLGLLLILVWGVVPLQDELILSVPVFVSCLYIVAGLLAQETAFAASHGVFKLVGFAGYFTFLYVLSFADVPRDLDDVTFSHVAVILYFAVPLVLALLGWLWLLIARFGQLDRLWRWHWALLAVSLVLVAAMSLELSALGSLAAILFNLVFLAHCVLFIIQGSRDVDARLVSLACVLFAVLVITRYVDLFDSLLLRSLVFLLLGAGVFVVGNFYARSKRRLQEAKR